MLRIASVKGSKGLPAAVCKMQQLRSAGRLPAGQICTRAFHLTPNCQETDKNDKEGKRWRSTGRASMREAAVLSARKRSNELARRAAIQEALSQNGTAAAIAPPSKASEESTVSSRRVSSLRKAFVDQLRPLDLDISPLPTAQPTGGGGGSGSDAGSSPGTGPTSTTANKEMAEASSAIQRGPGEDPARPSGNHAGEFVDRAFDATIRDDILNTILTGFVRKSHMLLYAEDPWSEGYSLQLLADVADRTGAHLTALDIPDWSVLTSRIDPVLEDLTIVSHPYSPPPDLEASGGGEAGRGMAFFAGINRRRFNDEGDALSEQIDPPSERARNGREEDGAVDDIDDRDSGIGGRPSDREIDAIRAQFGLGKSPGAGAAGDRLGANDEDAGDPVLSREMMSNPLPRDATERLDRVLADFVSAPAAADNAERPRIIAIKHLGDLMNTRVGYTLFSRLVSAVARHNSNPDAQPVVVVGLLHPSWFHPDTPPPGIPPFDVNPSTPIALMPTDDRPSNLVRGVNDIVEGLLGDDTQRVSGNRVGVHLVHMDGLQAGGRISRALGASPNSGGAVSSKSPEELPLFARVGIPPPAHAVLSTPCDMRAPEFAKQAKASEQVLVGSLRQAMVADQCLDRNARVIRNICLLYQISGLELTSQEAMHLATISGDVDLLNHQPGDVQSVVFNRETLYKNDHDKILPKQPRRNTWHLDYRPLTVMLRSLPDDVGRRYFFAETFLHRWISVAQALAIREKLSLDAIRKNPMALAEASKGTVLASRHLTKSWAHLVKSHIALRQGVLALPVDKSDDSAVAAVASDRGDDGVVVEKVESPNSEGGAVPLHRRVDYSEIGIGRRVEDDMDVSPSLPMLESRHGAFRKPASSAGTVNADKSPAEEVCPGKEADAASAQEPCNADSAPAYREWADVGRELEASEEDAVGDEGKSGKLPAILPPQRRIQMAKKNLTEYEQRLIGSVIDPQSIPTGFGQVCAKPETVATLQEIITLPMLRPEYFSRGVLRRHSVSGILLFGPPGTGKTMLAKAVAKESGSVVLNIRASDVYDKYVGEGEKLAEAVFTLARKLAPCVIFIDEVDALFAARSSGEANKFRRDIMNQIMSEWDGINSSKTGKDGAAAKSPPPQVMVMAATNRPFDLDDAILRRLPRRILIDLPGAADRAKILEIHLAGEDLDSDVDLKALAARTESFSGSDLKNLCVAAALAALRERVREEVGAASAGATAAAPASEANEEASGSKGSASVDASLIEQLKHLRRSPAPLAAQKPSHIKLAMRHFDVALKKVAPSSSDEMGSLVELRKWDKMYGDGAQERKRKHSIGFTATMSSASGATSPAKSS